MSVFDRLDAGIRIPPEERMFLETVAKLCQSTIAPNAAALDESGSFPWANIEALNELGANAMFIPQDYGGAGLSYPAYLAVCREISKACASTGIVWATNFHAASPLVDYASPEQKLRWLPRIAAGALAALALTEPHAGSDATGMRTIFRADGDDIVVNGSKVFITNGDVAELIVLFGKWSTLGDGKDAISLVVVERGADGFEVVGTERKMGIRASSTAALSFTDCRVPRANLLGEPGKGLPMLFDFLNKSRPSVAAHALGIARAAFEDAVAYINERVQFGRRVIDNQGIQFMLADMATDLALCESWLWQVADRIQQGETGLNVEASMLKMRAADLAMRITTDAVQLFGGYGYTRDYRAERLMRDAKITQIWEGTNQIHRQVIGRSFASKRSS